MYSRFILGNFENQDLNKKERHQYGAFVDLFPSKGKEAEDLFWSSKLRIDQAMLKSKEQSNSTDMVALLPQSSTILSLSHT